MKTFFKNILLFSCLLNSIFVPLIYQLQNKRTTMETIAQNTEFKIEFNGGKTYFITDNHGHCWKATDTKRKAINYFNKVSKLSGIA